MAKRTVTEIEAPAETHEGQPYAKAAASETGGAKRPAADAQGEMGEFEDEWEDEIESDGEVVDTGERDDHDEDAMEIDGDILPAIEEEDAANAREDEPSVFLPGAHELDKDEVLEPDQSVYEMLHSMNVTWPCLSFDVLRDNLGWERKRYPATSYIVTGTQANAMKNNEVLVMKMSHLHKTQKDDGDSDSSSDDDDDDASIDEDAILEYRSIPHHGSINRIRAQPLPGETLPGPSQPYHTATWSETGKVHIWDIRPLIESLNVPGYALDKTRTNRAAFTISAHGRAEGFAMDWSPASYASTASSGGPGNATKTTTVEPRILTGDIHSKIFLTTLTKSAFQTSPQPFTSHTSSVEDIQWSPTESTVFASCSADRSVRIWDVRMRGRKNVVGISQAHESDVNVISWNKGTTYLIASGGDEGGLKIWDLRNLKGDSGPPPSPVASLSWHTTPITSIEWHPTEDSAFVASDSTNQVTLWDLSVEADDEQIGSTKDILTAEGERLRNVPSQLLFVHQGQKDVKEVHWHPQIPGCVISTSADGFNVFKTISI